MPRRERKSDFERTVEGLAKLPWQLCLLLAPLAWFGFHQLAMIEPPAAHNVGEMGQSIGVMIFRTAGLFLQYLAPAALLLAALLKRTLFRGDELPFYMELPPYRMPTLRLLASQVWGSARAFLRRAGTIILAVSLALWVLLNFPRVEAPAGLGPAETSRHRLEHSFAGRAGHA
ncbi:MAG: hypothetical protein ACREMA_10605, partial [Longimicrobiales bacterium]